MTPKLERLCIVSRPPEGRGGQMWGVNPRGRPALVEPQKRGVSTLLGPLPGWPPREPHRAAVRAVKA